MSKYCLPLQQINLQNTYSDGQVEIWEKYQKYCNIFSHIINFKVLLWFKCNLGKLILIWAS